jgi:hypothetical protein
MEPSPEIRRFVMKWPPVTEPIKRGTLRSLASNWEFFQASFPGMLESYHAWKMLKTRGVERLLVAQNLQVIPQKSGRKCLSVRLSGPVFDFVCQNGGAKFLRQLANEAALGVLGAALVAGWTVVESRKGANLWRKSAKEFAVMPATKESADPPDETTMVYRSDWKAWAAWERRN